jgi:hypothetical protein
VFSLIDCFFLASQLSASRRDFIMNGGRRIQVIS